jgi:hypothetical protein
MKKILIIIAVLLVIGVLAIAGLVVFAFGQVDKIAKIAIEKGGTYAMQVDTTVESVEVSLTGGTATLGGLNIANPGGFDTDHFLYLGSADASIDIESLGADKIIIPSITLNEIDVILDKGQDPSNYNKILENLQRFESGDSAPSEPSEGGKNVVIQSLVLSDIEIHVANMPGVSLLTGDVAISIPEITLENVGEEESMKAGDIFNLVIKTVLAAAVEAGGGILPDDVLGELGNGLAGLASLGEMGITVISDLPIDDALKGLGEGVQDLTNQTGDTIKDVSKPIEDIGKGISDLFGGNKEDEDEGP